MSARAVLALALALAGCGSSPPEDANALLDTEACGRFSRTMKDFGAGILTESELRTRLQGVRDVGRHGSPRIAAASTGALAQVTSGTSDSAITAFREMTAACLKTDVNDPRITGRPRS